MVAVMDYCTFFPEGWWSHCCEAHDDDYLAQIGQAVADTALLQCVAGSGDGVLLTSASAVVGAVMYIGVRTFGRRWYRRAKRDPGQTTR